MESKAVKLHFFDVYGRAELIRLILAYNKVPFEDIRYNIADWPELKKSGNFLFGQLPVLEWEGKKMAQSMSIARFLCKTFGQYPHDVEDIYQAEAIADYYVDILMKFTPYFGMKDDESKKEYHEKFLKETLPGLIAPLNRMLKENKSGSGYFVGRHLTLADFAVFELVYRFIFHPKRVEITKGVLEENKELGQYLEGRKADFKSYFESRKQCFY